MTPPRASSLADALCAHQLLDAAQQRELRQHGRKTGARGGGRFAGRGLRRRGGDTSGGGSCGQDVSNDLAASSDAE